MFFTIKSKAAGKKNNFNLVIVQDILVSEDVLTERLGGQLQTGVAPVGEAALAAQRNGFAVDDEMIVMNFDAIAGESDQAGTP